MQQTAKLAKMSQEVWQQKALQGGQALRLRVLLEVAAAKYPDIASCVKPLSLRPSVSADSKHIDHGMDCHGFESFLTWSTQHLEECYIQLKMNVRSSACGRRGGTNARQKLIHLGSICEGRAPQSDGKEDATDGIHVILAWIDLFVAVYDALMTFEQFSARGAWPFPENRRKNTTGAMSKIQAFITDCSSKRAPEIEDSPLGSNIAFFGEEIHIAVSRLMHGFQWRSMGCQFPRILISFRILALRLMDHKTALVNAVSAGEISSSDVGGVDVSRIIELPPSALLPDCPSALFNTMASARIPAYSGHIRGAGARKGVEALPPMDFFPQRFPVEVGSSLFVDVETNAMHGVFLRSTYPCAGPNGDESMLGGVDVPCPCWAELMCQLMRRTCDLPLEFPHYFEAEGVCLKLQLVVRVDTCAMSASGRVEPQAWFESNLKHGGTCVAKNSASYRRLNELPLGKPQEVQFTTRRAGKRCRQHTSRA
jgi:hypothetical protein